MNLDLVALKAEIVTDPLARGYASMTDAQIADSLNLTVDRVVDTDAEIPTRRLFERFDPAEYAAAITHATNGVRNSTLLGHLLGMGTVGAGDPNVGALLTTVFGAVGASQTVKNLVGHASADAKWVGKDLRKKTVSRAVELFDGNVTPSDVAEAKNLP